jgi:energy-coupling factor transporter ATP-binding protein EcfA2
VSGRIKDLVEIVPVGNPVVDGQSEPERAIASFLLTYDLGDALTRVVERLAGNTEQPKNCLIVGSSGCGKSTLLSVASSLLEVDAGAEMHSRLAEIRTGLGELTSHVVRITDTGKTRRLASTIERSIIDYFRSSGLSFRSHDDTDSSGAWLDIIAEAAMSLPDKHRLIIAIDDLDGWLRGAGRYAYDNLQTMVRLGNISRTMPLSTCSVAGSGLLYDDANSADGQGWMAALHADFQIQYLPAHTVRTATASRVLRKNARQRREILEVLGRLREKLPELNYSDDEFIELYPLEVSTWTIGGHLHRWIEGFSFPEFAARAAESVRGRPSQSLFALNDMFSHYEPQLRRVESLGPIFAAYDHLLTESLPKLGQSQRLWGKLALQSMIMHTIADIPVDVITLTNSVLLYSLHGSGSSYVFMAAVLKQLESLGRGQIVATGEGMLRRYSLVSGQREAIQAQIDELADAIDDDDEINWALLGFGGQFFADWPLGTLTGGSGRSDLWDISQRPGFVALKPRLADGSVPDLADRPRLVILAPGRSWSEAREVVGESSSTACWIGAAPTPSGRQVLKQWLAVTRLETDDRTNRFSGLADLRKDLREQAASVFSRVYIERGMLVTQDRSDPMGQIVQPTRDENLVVRLIPAEVLAAVAQAATAGDSGSVVDTSARIDRLWLAHLSAETRDEVDDMMLIRDEQNWLQRLETWYAAGVARDVSAPVRLFGERGFKSGDIAAALEAKQQFDVALFSVRRTLGAGSLQGLSEALEAVFESHDRLWEARKRLEWLERFSTWLISTESFRRYLAEAETLEDADVETLRGTLVEWLDKPESFVDETRRTAFSDAFDAYRTEYIRYYAAEHDRSVSAPVIDRLSNALIESQAWQALEGLSALSIGNPSYLVEVTNLISTLRETQCDADVEALLADRPRCSCGFKFGDRSRIAAMAASASELIQTGVQHHRRLLNIRRSELRAKLKARKNAYALETIKTIAALTGDEEMPVIDADTVSALNDLLASRK